jgi:UrcA family protein
VILVPAYAAGYPRRRDVNPIRTLSLALIACSAFAAPVASASTISIPVSYGGLDLTTPAGIAALDARIEGAVRRICGRAYPVDLQAQADVRRCRAEARFNVQAQRGDALASAQNRRTQLASRGW